MLHRFHPNWTFINSMRREHRKGAGPQKWLVSTFDQEVLFYREASLLMIMIAFVHSDLLVDTLANKRNNNPRQNQPGF